MKMIRQNCRVQFAAQDIEFIVSILGRKLGAGACLVSLLSDPESRDLILDDETLLRALLERGGCLRVSTRLYFYVLVRHAFRRSGIQDRDVADYVAELLAEFAAPGRTTWTGGGKTPQAEYIFEMLAALGVADERARFLLRVHIGNYSLFLAGVFPARIRWRAESRGFPALSYYEDVGRTQYRLASDHKLAQRYELASVFGTLAERFETTRLALNDLSERLFSIEDGNATVEAMLRTFRAEVS